MKSRNIVALLLCVIMIILIAGCEKSEVNENEAKKAEVSETEVMDTEPVSSQVDITEIGKDGIDIDLTALSSTMVYSEVYNMMYYPGDFIGKTIKMSGMYDVYHDESTGKYYHACIISDATACCSQGLEFELTDEYAYPDDYPRIGEIVCVTGVFDTYQEGEKKYCTLRDAKLLP